MTYQPIDVRTWARQAGEPVAGDGQLSYQVATAYLVVNPGVTRRLAVEHGVLTPTRGKGSMATCEELAFLFR